MILFESSDSTGRNCFSSKVLRRWLNRLVVAAMLQVGIMSAFADAQTRYVSDRLVITFRTGPSSDNAITRNLTSGDRVEVLEELPDEGYSRVRLPDGADGWVLTRYLQPEPTAGFELEATAQQLAAERARAGARQQEIERLESELQSTSQALEATRVSSDELQSELSYIRSVSSEALQTSAQKDALARQVSTLTASLDSAQSEVDRLSRRERQNWFVLGAAVLLGGVIIGLIAPSLRPRRKSSW